MQMTLVRNATLLLNYGGHRLLLDPYFANSGTLPSFTGKAKNPLVDLPMPPDAIVDGVEMVLVSHLHADHFDEAAQAALEKAIPLFCQPGNDEKIREKGFTNVMPIAQSSTWQGITITRTDGHHGLGAVEQLMGTVSGFVLQAAGEPTIYWAGDTVLCDEVRAALAAHQPDVIITHSSGAMWPNPDDQSQRVLIVMDAAQTVATAQLAPAATLIATHMEALDHGTTSRADIRAAAAAAGISAEQLLIPADGETLVISG